jgi:hypothetical protein
MKKIFLIVGIVIVSLFILSVAKDFAIKSAVTIGATNVLGTPVHIDSLSLGILRQSVRIKGFKMYQPKGYPKGILLDIPKITVEYDLGALFKRKLHFPLVELDLKEAVIIKSQEGILNVDTLKVAQKPAPKKAKEKNGEKKPVKTIAMQIDVLKVNLGRVVSKGYTKDGQMYVKTFDINVKDKTYKNINSAQQLVALLLIEAMKPAAIKSAGLYGAVSLAGVAFLPVGIASVFTGKDSVSDTFSVGLAKAYKVSLDILTDMGTIKSQDKEAGIIKAKVSGADVTVRIEEESRKEVKVTISARKYLIPKSQIAGTVLHKLTEELR